MCWCIFKTMRSAETTYNLSVVITHLGKLIVKVEYGKSKARLYLKDGEIDRNYFARNESVTWQMNE